MKSILIIQMQVITFHIMVWKSHLGTENGTFEKHLKDVKIIII